MRRLFIALALAVLACASQAQPIAPERIGAHLATWHSAPGFCNLNPGVYAMWPGGVTVGAYRNSECHASAYVGRTWSTSGRLSVAVTAGAVTGYSRPIVPLLLPSAALAISDGAVLRLTFIPKVEKRGTAGVHLSLERRWL